MNSTQQMSDVAQYVPPIGVVLLYVCGIVLVYLRRGLASSFHQLHPHLNYHKAFFQTEGYGTARGLGAPHSAQRVHSAPPA